MTNPSGAAQAATPSTKMHCTIDTSEEFSALAKLTAQKIQRLGRWPNTVELERIVEAALTRHRTILAAAAEAAAKEIESRMLHGSDSIAWREQATAIILKHLEAKAQ